MTALTGGQLLRRSFRRHRGRLTATTALLCGHQAAETLVPVLIGVTIDQAVSTGDTTRILLWLGVLAALFTSLTLCWRFGARLGVVAQQRETHQLRIEVVSRVLDPRGHRTGRRAGEIMQVATSDAERAMYAMHALTLVPAAATALAVAAVVLLTIHVPLGLAVLIGVPVLVAVLQVLGPLLTRRATAAQEAAGHTTALATDLVRGVRALRGIGAQDSAAASYRRSSRATLGASLRAATTNGVYQGTSAAVSGLFLAAVAGFAGWLAVDGTLTIGELITVVGLAQFIAEPVRLFAIAGQMLANARASANRVADLLSAPTVLTPGTRTGPLPDRGVTLRGVTYRTLTGLDLTVGPGETVGVVGYEQRDCDALVELLSGAVPPEDYEGTITVGGVPAPELDLATGRREVLVEHHDVALFEGTLRTNLMVEDPAPALRAAAAEDIVAAHPDGLDHPVADRGTTLSGGQRQRIGLARALAADPPVLVLRDPTTAVDAMTEERIAHGIAELRRDASTVVITSSPALLAVADRVVVIADGHVIASGTHTELSEVDARYQEAVLR
ncbi:ABC transporter ATP-binding protein [Actinophytocola algeriensis]|uniref:Putative ABC transport system ATP-binding protein n=1 Tax=Actinophytocola algeriensis TaxID=1768010 RepID=A0A7W7QAM7_9PSEU|nr:ABC transporter ATP-binding protein [Actinophytocola algeriensis]MBB4909948.1 putative ABC transport system ATP-binding protein [Actinophytocola algeriensis]MBE1475938.1 putative ABC transport system ATP-binding protein [Actinophytocola algeriensis]